MNWWCAGIKGLEDVDQFGIKNFEVFKVELWVIEVGNDAVEWLIFEDICKQGTDE